MQFPSRILAALAMAVITSADFRNEILSSLVKNTLDSLRRHLRDLPISSRTIQLRHPRLDLTLCINDVHIRKLENFRIYKLETSLSPLKVTNLTIALDELKVTGRYSANGRANFPETMTSINIRGAGKAKIELKRIFLTIAGKFFVSGEKIQIAPKGLYGFDLFLGESKFELENFCGGGENGKVMNEFLGKFVPELVNRLKSPLFGKYSDFLINLENHLLSKLGPDIADTLQALLCV